MVLNSKQIIKLALIGAVSILIIIGLAKCSKKEAPAPPAAATAPIPIAAPAGPARTAEDIVRKLNAKPLVPQIIDEDLLPKSAPVKKDENEEQDSGPPMF